MEERRLALRIEAAGRTDVGRARRVNQDRFGVAEDLGLAVVCDGMGGPAGGEIASGLAMESFLTVARKEMESGRGSGNGSGNGLVNGLANELTGRSLRRAAAAANRAVRARASEEVGLNGMGTTLVAARMEGRELTVLNVGDSRAYVVRGGVARQVTEDHSYVGERVRMGVMTRAEAEQSPLQSVITRAVGIEDDVRPDICRETVEAGDRLLLCTDGLTRHVEDAEIGRMVESAESLESACEELIALANERGGSDNITCVLMRFRADDTEAG
jgi:protein phosphatase